MDEPALPLEYYLKVKVNPIVSIIRRRIFYNVDPIVVVFQFNTYTYTDYKGKLYFNF